MALKSPQEMKVTALDATPGTRFQSSIAPKIDTGFIDVLSKKVTDEETARVKKATEQLNLVKAQFKNKANSLRIDAQVAISDQQGVNALRETPKIQADYFKKLEKERDQFPSEYHQFLNQELAEEDTKLKTMAVPHLHGQMNKLKDETYKTQLNNDINFAIEKSADLNYLGTEGLAKVDMASDVALSRKYGYNPDYVVDQNTGATAGMMIKEGKKKARSETVLGSITLQAKLGPKGFQTAEKIYEGLDQEMTPEDRVKALGFLNTAREQGESKAAITLAQDAISIGGGNIQKTMEYALANTKTDKEGRITSAFIKDHFAGEKKQKAKEYADNLAEANEVSIASGKVPWEILNNKMNGEQRTKWLESWNKNGGRAIPAATNYAVFSQVSDALHSMSPTEAKSFNLRAHAMEIGPEQMESLERLRNEKMKKVQDEKDKAQGSTIKSYRDIVNKYVLINDVFDPKQKGLLEDIAFNEWERMKSDKNVTIPQMQARLNQAMKKGLMVDKVEPGILWDTKTTAITESLAPDMSNIHESNKLAFRKQVLAKYKRLPTPAEEQTQLEKLIISGKDLTIPR